MKKNILVTGAHRSGTTWTGRVIAKAPEVRYVQEPFNIQQAGKNSPLRYWYEYLDGTSKDYQDSIQKYLDTYFKKDFSTTINQFKQINSVINGYGITKDLLQRHTKERTLFKDPIALMSSAWLSQRYNMQVVVLTRHPAAFVASLKIKNWRFNFKHIYRQKALVNRFLPSYAEKLAAFAKQPPDIIEQGILLWNIMNQVVLKYREKYQAEWYFVNHEDLSIQPQTEFKRLFEFLNLSYDKNVEKYLKISTTAKTSSEWERNAFTNIKTWQERLTQTEIERIKEATQPVWQHFYTESDW